MYNKKIREQMIATAIAIIPVFSLVFFILSILPVMHLFEDVAAGFYILLSASAIISMALAWIVAKYLLTNPRFANRKISPHSAMNPDRDETPQKSKDMIRE